MPLDANHFPAVKVRTEEAQMPKALLQVAQQNPDGVEANQKLPRYAPAPQLATISGSKGIESARYL